MDMDIADNQKKTREKIVYEPWETESEKKRKGNRENQVNIKTGFIIFNPMRNCFSHFSENEYHPPHLILILSSYQSIRLSLRIDNEPVELSTIDAQLLFNKFKLSVIIFKSDWKVFRQKTIK